MRSPKQLQHERGAGEREREAEQHGRSPVEADELRCDQRDRHGRHHHLGTAEAEHDAPHDPESTRLQFESDDEQQQHHPDLGEVHHFAGRFLVQNEADAAGADEHPGGEIAEHRRKAQAFTDGHYDDRGAQKYQRFSQEIHG